MKKISLITVLALILSVFSLSIAETTDLSDCFEYEVYDGIGIITKYTGTDENVEVPSEIDGHPIFSIDVKAFENCQRMTSITIPDSVIFIGSYAFYGCESLTTVTLSNNMAHIAYSAFDHCPSLVSVNVSDSVNSSESIVSADDFDWERWLGGESFQDCISLTSFTVPAGIANIGDAFVGCESLTSVIIPSSVTYINENAFCNCGSSFMLTVEPGSYAEQYAIENGISYITTMDSQN